ncbi:MAG: class I tRNA ligase family protein [Bacteroidales bacterium]|nr:class I tRNA ligase family protein [Bacteroidales bacterium]
MAEYVLWEELRDKKLGVEFFQEFKSGSRRFDFYAPEVRLIIEIKRQQALDKLATAYEQWAKEHDYTLLLIPIRDFLDQREQIVQRIKDAIAGKEVEAFVEKESIENFPAFVSKNIAGREQYSDPINVDISLVHNDILDIEAFKKWQPHLADARFVLEDGKYICGYEVEKMSKSKFNVQNPDELIDRYGADTLRIYEMFLGPIEQSKPWDTQGIEGVFRFIRKLWRLFHNDQHIFNLSDETPTDKEWRVLHKTIRKVEDDIERYSFNTAVSAFMIGVNELTELKCNKRQILEPFIILISPYAPHIAEELWHLCGHEDTVVKQKFPVCDERYLIQQSVVYPVSFNGKTRFKIELPADIETNEIESAVLAHQETKRWTEGKQVRKIIVIPQRIINIVVG